MGLRVFDGVLYNGEADMLECRLQELSEVVDKFVIIIGDKSFTGRAKERENLDRFDPWADKIEWVAFETPVLPNPWDVEAATRNQLFVEFERLGVRDEDIVTVCDCDEIWAAKDLAVLEFGWYAWVMKRTVMSVYWRLEDEYTAVAGPWGKRGVSAQSLRSGRYGLPVLYSGWHLSWMGGPEWAARKMREFCHQELMVADPEGFMAENYLVGRSIRGERLVEQELDSSLPWWVLGGRAPVSWYRRRQQ